jgi:hypothetical protein
MNLSGDFWFFCQKLIIFNRLHLNLQVKNGSQIPVQRPNFFSEGLTFQDSSFNLKIILRLREQMLCQALGEPAERRGKE